MKLWMTSALVLLLLSGCNSTQKMIQLQNKNAQQALLIQQQQAKIEALTKQLQNKSKTRRFHRSSTLPPPPKRNIKLKKVEDTNFNADYMYPQTKTRVSKPQSTDTTKTEITTNSTMTKEACIAMIGEEKFNKYTEMFGSEASSIKRCSMLKAMKH